MDHIRPTSLPCPIISTAPLHGIGRGVVERIRAVTQPITRNRGLIAGNLIALAILLAVVLGTVWLMSGDGSQASDIASGPLPNSTSLLHQTP
jgi:tetrahydromethanopterin S-methyltransferase subunit F